MLGKYRKTITAVVTGVIGWAGVVIASDATGVTAAEWLGLAVAVATALGVYGVPNDPPAPARRSAPR
jgi:hypothetical protein